MMLVNVKAQANLVSLALQLQLHSVVLSGAATQITVADESSDTTCFPLFVTAATGDLATKSGTNLTFNSEVQSRLDATQFVEILLVVQSQEPRELSVAM